MNHIVKKAGISLLSGVMCTIGSWVTKQMLEKAKEEITKELKMDKKKEINPA